MDSLPPDILKLIAFYLNWRDVLNLSKVGKRYGLIHTIHFWQQKLINDRFMPDIKYDNPFCNYLLDIITGIRYYSNKPTPREDEELFFGEKSKILTKYLKHKYPQNYKFYHLDLYSNGLINRWEKIEQLQLKKHNLVHITINQQYEQFLTETYFMVDDDINNIEISHDGCYCTNKIGTRSTIFEDFLLDYGLSWESARWLYLSGTDFTFI